MPGTASVIFFSCAGAAAAKAASARPTIHDFPIIGSSLSVAALAPVPRHEAADGPIHRHLDADAEEGEHEHGDEGIVVVERARVEENVEAQALERNEELGDDRGDERAARRQADAGEEVRQ